MRSAIPKIIRLNVFVADRHKYSATTCRVHVAHIKHLKMLAGHTGGTLGGPMRPEAPVPKQPGLPAPQRAGGVHPRMDQEAHR